MISYKSFHRVDADDGDNAAVAVVVAGAAAGQRLKKMLLKDRQLK